MSDPDAADHACPGSTREVRSSPSATLTVVPAGTEQRAAWDAFAAANPAATIYHDYRWRTLIESLFGHQTVYLLARDATEVRAILPLVRLKSRLFGDFMVSMPYFNYGGVASDSSGAEEAVLAEATQRAAKLGVQHIELRHRDRACLDWPSRDDKVAMTLELPSSEDELWRGFPAKLKSQIRRPGKSGAVARQGGGELVGDFYSVFARNMRDLGTPVYPRSFFEAILAAFPAEAKVFVVDYEGKPAAAGIVLAYRDTLEIPWASSLREVNSVGVNMLLYWAALRDAVARGLRRFDFGRSTRDSGTYRFKQQWGAVPTTLRWHYWLAKGSALPRLTPSNPKYRAAIGLWRRLPLPVANFVGPRIVKNLP
jgi:FemAB-related protein (PEP-CTERM system-associated)